MVASWIFPTLAAFDNLCLGEDKGFVYVKSVNCKSFRDILCKMSHSF